METRRRLRETGADLGWLLPAGCRNAITDVPGVQVGHAPLAPAGLDPAACTGVTVVIPHPGDLFQRKCPGAVWALNGAGECTGAMLINEWGALETPIFLTGTPSVGRVFDAALDCMMARSPEIAATPGWTLPCVAECYDGWLNDGARYRAGKTEVEAALAAAGGGAVAEGAVGGGRGMLCYEFKGGIGTASRCIPETGWHVGALTMCNFGRREELLLAGVRLGAALADVPRPARPPVVRPRHGAGSVIAVLATDAPLGHHGLRRLCKRAPLGLARTGAAAHHGSGDIVIAFSTATDAAEPQAPPPGLFQSVVEAVEEAVLNALFAAADTTGRDQRTAYALPIEQAVTVLRARRPDLFHAI